MPGITDIDQRLKEIGRLIEEHTDAIYLLEEEAEELESAKETLSKYLSLDGSQELTHNNSENSQFNGLTKKQSIVFQAIPIGKVHRKKPIDIASSCPKVEQNYVRTTLWRLAEYGRIESENGFYWRMSNQ
ncbi:hypothetical protein [Parasphingorhabdus sp.]|uniref:hypothetical protein n=1 Tax=Parasphingorhabdus sp. TaxID=2709688 RepID=UPI003A95783E